MKPIFQVTCCLIFFVIGTRFGVAEDWQQNPSQVSVFIAFSGDEFSSESIEAIKTRVGRGSKSIFGERLQFSVKQHDRATEIGALFDDWKSNLNSNIVKESDSGAALRGSVEDNRTVFVLCRSAPFSVSAIEYDSVFRVWGPLIKSNSRANIPQTILNAIVAAAPPIARIESVDDQQVTIVPQSVLVATRTLKATPFRQGSIGQLVPIGSDSSPTIVGRPVGMMTVAKLEQLSATGTLKTDFANLDAKKFSRSFYVRQVIPIQANTRIKVINSISGQPIQGLSVAAGNDTQKTDSGGFVRLNASNIEVTKLTVRCSNQVVFQETFVVGQFASKTIRIPLSDLRLNELSSINRIRQQLRIAVEQKLIAKKREEQLRSSGKSAQAKLLSEQSAKQLHADKVKIVSRIREAQTELQSHPEFDEESNTLQLFRWIQLEQDVDEVLR